MTEKKSAAQSLLDKTQEDVWARGQEYAQKGNIKITTQDEKHIEASASGTQEYQVSLTFTGGGLSKKCTCPSRFLVCKHIVAVALVWDESRGIALPGENIVKIRTIPKPTVTRKMINALFKNPLHADLQLLRTMTDHGSWVRPHARLPLHPPFDSRETEPLTLEEVSTVFKEMKRWTKRKNYDPYFCAGEMMAAFCEVLRLIQKRLSATPPAISGNILREAQKFYFELLHRFVDTSNGIHVFPNAHLENIYETLKALPEKDAELEKYLKEFEEHREDY